MLWVHTLDQHHTGSRLVEESAMGHTLDQHHTGLRLVEESAMGPHTGSTSHLVEGG